MFGPDSGKGSWSGLNLMYENVRISDRPERQQRAANLLKVRPRLTYCPAALLLSSLLSFLPAARPSSGLRPLEFVT
jgi:hypothetical protein